MGEHTPGPLLPRRINQEARPFAVINPKGPHGDEIVGAYMTEGDAHLYAAAPDLLAAAKEARDQLWLLAKDPKNNPWVQQLNAAIVKAEPLRPEPRVEERDAS